MRIFSTKAERRARMILAQMSLDDIQKMTRKQDRVLEKLDELKIQFTDMHTRIILYLTKEDNFRTMQEVRRQSEEEASKPTKADLVY